MSQENVEIVRRCNAAFNSGDREGRWRPAECCSSARAVQAAVRTSSRSLERIELDSAIRFLHRVFEAFAVDDHEGVSRVGDRP